MILSLPARGVWVEIMKTLRDSMAGFRHSPRGECGLKFGNRFMYVEPYGSLPARGVWVEIKR